jgi:hypothetical protein
MDNPFLMCVLDRLAHGEEESKPILERELAFIAEADN